MSIHALKPLMPQLAWEYWPSNKHFYSFIFKQVFAVFILFNLTFGIANAETFLVTSAEIAPGLYTRSNSLNTTWSRVNLSDVWRRQNPCRSGFWTYRIPLDSFPSYDDRAFLVFRAGNRIHFFLDDQIIDRYGDLFNPDADFSNHAILVSLPRYEIVRDPRAFVYIQVAGDCTRYSGLSQILLGSQQELSELHSEKLRTFLWSTISIIVICSILGFISLFAAILYRSSDALMFGIHRKLLVAHTKLCASRAFWLVAYPTQSHEMLFDAHS